ncbi:FeoC-like transcriptional regulator [Psychromonas sp.]|nr:FeoC-like transcriptional regulator [Psychromonas sp.]
MILKRLSAYIELHQRVEESALLKEFRLHKNGLAPMIEILIASGHIQKTVNNRGERLPAQVFYSWHEKQLIPMTTLL